MRRAHQLGKLYHNCRHEVRRHDSAWGDGAEVVVRAIARPQLRFRASIWSPTPNNCCTPSLGLHKAFLNEPTSAGRDLVAFPGASDNAARHAREWEPNRALIHLEQRLELRKTQSVFFDWRAARPRMTARKCDLQASSGAEFNQSVHHLRWSSAICRLMKRGVE